MFPPGANRGFDPSDIADLSQAVREGIRTEFAHVTSLPAVFNSADVVAEQCPNGLCQAFTRTCEAVIHGPRLEKQHKLFKRPNDWLTGSVFRDIWLIDRQAVRRAYRQDWVPAAHTAYETAMDEVEQNRLTQYLVSLHRTAEPALIMEVLNAYQKYHRRQGADQKAPR